MAKVSHPYAGAPKKKPTLKHRPAIWECMLGTVYAMNDDREVKYFDYDWDAARAFAGVDESGRDPRVFKNTRRVSWTEYSAYDAKEPPLKRTMLWIKDPA